MAEGDVVVYNIFKKDILNGVHDLSNDAITMTLHTSYTPDIDAHVIWGTAGVSSTEYGSGSGYTAGGQTVTVTVAVDNTNDRADVSLAAETWTSLGALTPATPSHAILWNNTPVSPADPLICYIVLGTTATNGGDYTIDASGDLLRLS